MIKGSRKKSRGGGGVRAWPLREAPKKLVTKLEGGKALVSGPLKRELFPKYNNNYVCQSSKLYSSSSLKKMRIFLVHPVELL